MLPKYWKAYSIPRDQFPLHRSLPVPAPTGSVSFRWHCDRDEERQSITVVPGNPDREAFPWDSAPRFLLRDRDRIFGSGFTKQVEEFGIEEVLGAPGVPQQRAYIERVIGTIRRECLDHVIIVKEAALRRHLKLFLEYYHGTRTHLSLEKETPERRSVEPPEVGA